ncbi:hypothetical protein CRENBAI_016077 [Crenichthys baileyi]|uniref:Uncharacterized protein n=1 Tax=Crenichthys baileyi TaxID=28760 RepID=A0AAV9RJS4_9TELE
MGVKTDQGGTVRIRGWILFLFSSETQHVIPFCRWSEATFTLQANVTQIRFFDHQNNQNRATPTCGTTSDAYQTVLKASTVRTVVSHFIRLLNHLPGSDQHPDDPTAAALLLH